MDTPLPIPFRTNPSLGQDERSVSVINAYAEVNQDGKSQFTLVPTAGMKAFGIENGGGCRGLTHVETDNVVYAVQGSRLFKYASDGTATALGFISGVDPVYFAKNSAEPQQILLVSDGIVYLIEDGELSIRQYKLTTINEDDTESEENLTFSGVTYSGGYFILWQPDGRFYVLDLQTVNFRDLAFATAAESDSDGLTVVHGINNAAYMIGPETIEVWSIVGGDFPFRRVQGTPLRFGTKSPHTVRDFANGVALVADDNTVRLVQGYSEATISSNEITRLIESDPNRENIVGFTHERGQNRFYVLQGTGWTREYNAATGDWRTRKDIQRDDWHCVHCVEAFGKFIFGDKITGQLFESDYSIFTDNGKELIWGFVTPIIHDSPNGLSFNSVDIDIETGRGDAEAFLMLTWSDDNGRTWSPERRLSLGKSGQYKNHIKAHRLGRTGTKGRLFKITISDPVVRSIHGVYADARRVSL